MGASQDYIKSYAGKSWKVQNPETLWAHRPTLGHMPHPTPTARESSPTKVEWEEFFLKGNLGYC